MNDYYNMYREENRWQTLHTEGNKLLNAKDDQVKLKGVNCASLEWLCNPQNLLRTVCAACDDWKANIIRLPLSQDKWFGFGDDQKGEDESGERFRQIVDDIVGAIASRNKYVILDLHRSNCGSWGEFISGGMADMNSLAFWKNIACRYKNHPNVLFGLYNEPFKVSWDVWKDGGMITTYYEQSDIGNQIMFDKTDRDDLKSVTYPVPGMQKMVDNVRSVGAKNLVIIAGLDWGYELNGIPEHEVIDKIGNGIMLDSHLYPWKELGRWDELVTVMEDKYPILIGECGHYGESVIVHEGPQRSPSSVWVPDFLKWVEDHHYHITAWDFHDTAGPSLIKNLNDFAPTSFWGSYYKAFLEKHNG